MTTAKHEAFIGLLNESYYLVRGGRGEVGGGEGELTFGGGEDKYIYIYIYIYIYVSIYLYLSM